MSFPPFSLQTLIDTLSLEDSQHAPQNSGGGNRLFGGRDNSRTSSRLASGIGWGNRDSQVTIESVEAWGKLINIQGSYIRSFSKFKMSLMFCLFSKLYN